MRYLVTGSAGFIGSHLAEALQGLGHDVVGLDCFTDYYDPALKEENARGLDVRRLDLAQDPLDFAGFDGVFHLAAQPGVRSFGDVFPLYLRRNVLASQLVFEAAVRDGVKVVFSSSSSVYGAAEHYPMRGEVRIGIHAVCHDGGPIISEAQYLGCESHLGLRTRVVLDSKFEGR